MATPSLSPIIRQRRRRPLTQHLPFQGGIRPGEALHHIPFLLAGRTGNPLSGALALAFGMLPDGRSHDKALMLYV